MDNRTIEQVRENETIWINKAIKLEQENKQLKVELQEANDNIIWWSNRFNAVERDNKQLKEDKKKAKKYIDEEVLFEDMFGEGEDTFLEDVNTKYYKGLKEILGDKE